MYPVHIRENTVENYLIFYKIITDSQSFRALNNFSGSNVYLKQKYIILTSNKVSQFKFDFQQIYFLHTTRIYATQVNSCNVKFLNIFSVYFVRRYILLQPKILSFFFPLRDLLYDSCSVPNESSLINSLAKLHFLKKKKKKP